VKLCLDADFQRSLRRMTISSRYTTPAIVLHWVIAVLMVANVLLVLSTDLFPQAAERPMIDLHKSLGITVLGLAAMRLLWRLTHKPPALPASYAPWERIAAHAAHWVLYGLIFLLPLSGWVHDSAWKDAPSHPLKLFWVIPWFRFSALTHLDPATKERMHDFFFQVHTSLGYVLYAMFAVHVAGALKHQFIDREPELQRMMPD
jgi:cytochrome b561